MNNKTNKLEDLRNKRAEEQETICAALNEWTQLDLLTAAKKQSLYYSNTKKKIIKQTIIDPDICAVYNRRELAITYNAARAALRAVNSSTTKVFEQTRAAIMFFLKTLTKFGDTALAYNLLLKSNYAEAFDVINSAALGFMTAFDEYDKLTDYERKALQLDKVTYAYNTAKSYSNKYFKEQRRVHAADIASLDELTTAELNADEKILDNILFDVDRSPAHAPDLSAADTNSAKIREIIKIAIAEIDKFEYIVKAAEHGAKGRRQIAEYITTNYFSISPATVSRVILKAYNYMKTLEPSLFN